MSLHYAAMLFFLVTILNGCFVGEDSANQDSQLEISLLEVKLLELGEEEHRCDAELHLLKREADKLYKTIQKFEDQMNEMQEYAKNTTILAPNPNISVSGLVIRRLESDNKVTVNIEGSFTNNMPFLVKGVVVNGYVWSDRSQNIALNDMLLSFPGQGINHNMTAAISYTIYDSEVTTVADDITTNLAFAKSSQYGFAGYIADYIDASGVTHQVDDAYTPQKISSADMDNYRSLKDKIMGASYELSKVQSRIKQNKRLLDELESRVLPPL